MVDVAPRQMLAAGEVVELVAEIAVAMAERELKDDVRGGDRPDQPLARVRLHHGGLHLNARACARAGAWRAGRESSREERSIRARARPPMPGGASRRTARSRR